MEITIIGVFVFTFCLILSMFSHRWLFDLLIFLIPFSATSAINFGLSGVQIYIVVLFFNLCVIFFNGVRENSIVVSRTYLQYISIIIIFSIIACISLYMPYYINGSEIVKFDDIEYYKLYLTNRNLTQLLYLFIGLFLSCYVCVKNLSILKQQRTLKIYSYSILFIIIWGYIELSCFYLSIDFPSFIFNNNPNDAAQGFNKVLITESGLNLKRISSVTVEPSIYVQSILLGIPFFINSIFLKKYLINRQLDIFILININLSIILSTSSSGLVGLLFCYILIVFLYKKSYVLIFAFLFIILLFVSFVGFDYQEILQKLIFEKNESSSGVDRLLSIIDGWELFKKYPILGIGWGSSTIHDLFVKILCYTGILGFTFFFYFIGVLIKNLISQSFTQYTKPSLISLLTFLFMSVISGFSYYFGHGWFIIGFAMAVSISRIYK